MEGCYGYTPRLVYEAGGVVSALRYQPFISHSCIEVIGSSLAILWHVNYILMWLYIL